MKSSLTCLNLLSHGCNWLCHGGGCRELSQVRASLQQSEAERDTLQAALLDAGRASAATQLRLQQLEEVRWASGGVLGLRLFPKPLSCICAWLAAHQ